jgi:sigma-B regulation protein RsbU (phosphoserine phosphatase)
MVVKDRLVGLVYVDTSLRTGAFSEADRDLLTAVSAQAGIAIENARLYAVAVEKGRMERELQMAREIQESLLPRHLPHLPGYDVSAVWHAAREMAGDFYDMFALEGGALGVVVADVSDKGAPAALFMAAARSFIRGQAFGGHSPLATLSLANDLIVEDADSGMFVTAHYSVFHAGGHSVHVNAGHNPPLLYRRAAHTVSELPRGGRALGWFKDNPLTEIVIDLAPGDMLIYFTDGLTEAENYAGADYGTARVKQALLAAAGQPAAAVLEELIADVETFCAGRPLLDDLTVVIVRFETQTEE